MARPHKFTVDYFPHYTTHGKTMFVLETRWGNDGYAFWFKLLESLGKANGMFIDVDDPAVWEFMLAKTHLNHDTAIDILDLLAKMNAIDPALWEHRVIFIDNFVTGIMDAFKRRKDHLPTREGVIAYINSAKGGFCMQKPGKERKGKGKESKVEISSISLSSEKTPDGEDEGIAVKTARGKQWGTSDDLRLAQWMFEKIKVVNPTAKEPQFASWANEVRLMRQVDKRTHKEIATVFSWANKDHFWSANILSPKNLRKHYDKLETKSKQQPPPDKNSSKIMSGINTLMGMSSYGTMDNGCDHEGTDDIDGSETGLLPRPK